MVRELKEGMAQKWYTVLRNGGKESWQRLRGLQCAEKTLGCNTGAWAVVAAGTSRHVEKDLAVSGVEEGKRHCWRAVQKGPTI